MDTHAILQHRSAAQGEDLSQLEKVLRNCDYTLLVLDPAGGPLRRAWCLFELAKTLLAERDNQAHASAKGAPAEASGRCGARLQVRAGTVRASDRRLQPLDRKALWGMFGRVDVATAEATFPEDREMIFEQVAQIRWDGLEGHEAVNWMVQQALITLKSENDAFGRENDESADAETAAAAAAGGGGAADDGVDDEKRPFVGNRGTYLPGARLGTAAYGIVISADVEGAPGVKVALKQFDQQFTGRGASKAFAREVALLAALRHPCINRLFDVFHDPRGGGGGRLWAAYEVRGKTEGSSKWNRKRNAARYAAGLVLSPLPLNHVLACPCVRFAPQRMETDLGAVLRSGQPLSDQHASFLMFQARLPLGPPSQPTAPRELADPIL